MVLYQDADTPQLDIFQVSKLWSWFYDMTSRHNKKLANAVIGRIEDLNYTLRSGPPSEGPELENEVFSFVLLLNSALRK